MLERMQWAFGEAFKDDLDLEVRLERDPFRRSLVATVKAWLMSREMTDEKTLSTEVEMFEEYAGPFDHLKEIFNGWLDRFEKACKARSIEPIKERFKVQKRKREVVVKRIEKRVYHMCPHIAKDHKDHSSWIMGGPAGDRTNFRAAHYIKGLVERGIRESPHEALGTLHEIRHYLQTTGAFSR